MKKTRQQSQNSKQGKLIIEVNQNTILVILIAGVALLLTYSYGKANGLATQKPNPTNIPTPSPKQISSSPKPTPTPTTQKISNPKPTPTSTPIAKITYFYRDKTLQCPEYSINAVKQLDAKISNEIKSEANCASKWRDTMYNCNDNCSHSLMLDDQGSNQSCLDNCRATYEPLMDSCYHDDYINGLESQIYTLCK